MYINTCTLLSETGENTPSLILLALLPLPQPLQGLLGRGKRKQRACIYHLTKCPGAPVVPLGAVNDSSKMRSSKR